MVDCVLCECGCGEPTTLAKSSGKGRVKGQPCRFIHGHNPRGVTRRTGPDYLIDDAGCWVWQHAMSTGYGRLSVEGKDTLAHRHYYEKHVGPIPEGLQLDHLCRNRACVNPAHLEPVTNAENARRGATAKLTREAVAEIRSTDGRGTRELAARFGVHRRTIWQARTGRTWDEMDDNTAKEAA